MLTDDEGRARLLIRSTNFEGALKAVYAQLRQLANTDVAVTATLFESLGRLAELTARERRLALLRMHGNLIWDGLENQGFADYDRRDIRQRHRRLQIFKNRLN